MNSGHEESRAEEGSQEGCARQEGTCEEGPRQEGAGQEGSEKGEEVGRDPVVQA
jgi:hypothetical protein